MSTVLMGWEFGAGHGHVQTLMPVARALAARGHQPVFAVRDVVESWPVLRKENFPVFPAPFWPSRMGRHGEAFLARTYGDILTFLGWSEPDELEAMIRGWDALIDLVRPDLVVIDSAPGLALATWKRIPTVGVGTGFSNPPAQLRQYPDLDPDAPALRPDSDILASVAEVQRRRRRPAPDTLAATLAHGPRWVTTFPELDIYRAVRSEMAVGPMSAPPAPLPRPPAPRWFGYFTAQRSDLERILRDFAASGIPGDAYVRGASSQQVQHLRAAGLEIHAQPVPIGEALARAAVVAHSGGIGLTANALAAGRPQLLFPEHLEQRLTAKVLAGLGVGLTVRGSDAPGAALRRILKGELFALDAEERGASIAGRGPWRGLETVVQSCLGAI